MVQPGADPTNRLERFVSAFVQSVQPKAESIHQQMTALRASRGDLSDSQLAELWSERICRYYAAEGAVSALPSVLPGLGTSVQLAIEGGTLAADIAYMLRCMADIVMGVGHAYGRHIEHPFNEEFVRVLGIWCGALSLGKEAAVRVGTKVAVAQVKRVPAEVFKRFQKNLGRHILTEIGLRRGGVTLGRLVPFGIGALVGGGFNYATMRGFRKTTLSFYGGGPVGPSSLSVV